MIEHTEITGYIEIRIEQGCGYSMDLANIRIGRETATADARGRNLFQTSCYLLFNPILDDAQGQRFLQAGILSGQKSDQITAIFEDVLLVFKHMLGDTAQEASSMSDKLLQKAHPDKATIGHDKHPRLNRAQQPLGQTVFRSGAGSNHGINNGVSSYLYQIDAMQLRKRALRRACTAPTKIGHIGWGVSHIFIRAIDCHEAQTKGKCPWCVGTGQGLAFEPKEAAKDLDPNLFASIHPSSSPWQFLGILLYEIAFRTTQLGVDSSQRRTQEQAPADQDIHHDCHRQLACSGRLVMKRCDQLLNRFAIIEAFQDWQTEGLTQLVLIGQLHYLEWHEVSPSDVLAFVSLEYVRFEAPLSSYLSGIGRQGVY